MRKLFSSRIFWVFALLMVCAGASEQAMSQWASAFAESGLQISKSVGDLAGPCMFSILMGLSRVFYAKFSEKIHLKAFMAGSGALCIASYLLASLCPNPLLSLIGCGLCGLSVGVLWPGTFSLASASCPRGGTAMFALLALAGDLGCSAGLRWSLRFRCGGWQSEGWPACGDLLSCAVTVRAGSVQTNGAKCGARFEVISPSHRGTSTETEKARLSDNRPKGGLAICHI